MPASRRCCRRWPARPNRCVIPEHLVRHRAPDRAPGRGPAAATRAATRWCWSPRGPRFAGDGDMSSRAKRTDAYGHRKLGRHRRPDLGPAQGAVAAVQQGQEDRHREPAARLSRAFGRPGRARLDRADGLRQPRARPLDGRATTAVSSACATGATTTCRSTSSPRRRRWSTWSATTTPDRLRPQYRSFEHLPLFIMTSEV